MEEVGAEKFRKMVEEFSFAAGLFGGAEELQVFCKILDLYIHRAAVPSDEVRALLEGREAIFQASNSWWSCLLPGFLPAA